MPTRIIGPHPVMIADRLIELANNLGKAAEREAIRQCGTNVYKNKALFVAAMDSNNVWILVSNNPGVMPDDAAVDELQSVLATYG